MQPSPYARVGAKLIDNGYSAIPVMPHSKIPGEMSFGKWYAKGGWNEFCNRLPSQYEVPLWERWPDAGVCVAIDHKLKVVDIDTDDPTMMAAVLAVLPDSPVKKRGQKGFSAFYRGSGAIVSVPFSIAVPGETRPVRVVDLLAHGRQTVIPPTIHKDTGKPYEWTTEDTLLDTDIDQLPMLPDNIADVLADVLAPFGFVPLQESGALVRGEGETCWRELNDTAIRNYDKWVPALRLPGTKPVGKGYRAVAIWRGVENANLSFHSEGIMDWGNNESHTPIDVVIKAFSTDFYTATKWLCDQTGFNPFVSDDFDIAGFIAREHAKKEIQKPPEKPLVAPVTELVTTEPSAVPSGSRIAAPRGKLNPFDPEEADGLLGAIAEWIYGTARRPVPEFAMLGAVAFLSVLYGRQFVGPTGLASNIYLVGIGGPGYGKDHPLRCVPLLAHDCGMSFLVGPSDVTSGSAIERVVRAKSVFFMPWDEFGVILQGMTGNNAQSWTKSIRKVLLELYSRSTSMWTGKENSDPKRASASAEPVYWPHVSILGMSTPTEFYAGITDSNLSDGLMARLTVIFSNARPVRQKTKSLLIPPPSLITAIKDSVARFPKHKGNLNKDGGNWRIGNKAPPTTEVPWEDSAAEKRLEEIEDWQFSAIDDDPLLEGIVGRAGEQSVKLAMIRAVSRNPSAPTVSLADMEWGWAFVQRSLDSIDAGVKSYMVGSDFERLHKTILDHVTAAGRDGIRKSDLMKKRGVSRAKPIELDAAIKWNMDANLLAGKLVTPAKGGRPGMRYIATEFDVGVSDKEAAA